MVPVRPYNGALILPVVGLVRVGGSLAMPIGGGFVLAGGRTLMGGGFVVPVGRAKAVGEITCLLAGSGAVAPAGGVLIGAASGVEPAEELAVSGAGAGTLTGATDA